MSNAVVLTSNNAEFENYLSDTFRLKKNSEVCLAKAAVSVPVEIHQFATVPIIPAAERTHHGGETTGNGAVYTPQCFALVSRTSIIL